MRPPTAIQERLSEISQIESVSMKKSQHSWVDQTDRVQKDLEKVSLFSSKSQRLENILGLDKII